MAKKLQINKTVMLTTTVGVAISFMVSACSPSTMVCLTGLCPSIEEQMAKIPWAPPLLDHKNCHNISGKYKARIYVDDINYNDLMIRFPQQNDQFGYIHVYLEEPKEIPSGRFIPMPVKNNLKAGRWDESEFYDGAYVLVNQENKKLMASLMKNGELYRRQTVDLNSTMIGCDGNDLVIRTIFPSGTTVDAGGPGWTTATEKRFRKLADGSLQLTIYVRTWEYNYALGLRGLNPDGTKNDTGIPREGRGTVIFPGIP